MSRLPVARSLSVKGRHLCDGRGMLVRNALKSNQLKTMALYCATGYLWGIKVFVGAGDQFNFRMDSLS